MDGRPHLPGRAVLSGIIFVLKTDTPWDDFPKEMNRGSGMTCWRRLRDWQKQGVEQKLHELGLAELRSADDI